MVTYPLMVKLLLRLSTNIWYQLLKRYMQIISANPASNHENPITYLSKAFNQPFPTINLKGVSSKEIEDNKVTQNKNHMDMME